MTGEAGFRTYVGLRYVPIIIGVWDRNREYEALSIVVYEGNSYTSKKPVPAGVDLANETYWVMTGNYNVQVANLQNQVEVAVQQILDYATDFETFKQGMMKLYEDFTVDADGQIKASVEQFEAEIGEQYEEFIRYVNNALNDFRTEMTNFTESTTARIDAFITSSNLRIDTKFNTYENQMNTKYDEFSSTTGAKINALDAQVNNLVLQAGNPESSSAEIVQARQNRTRVTPYDTLQDSINALFDNGLFYHGLVIDQTDYINLNLYDTIGIYTSNVGGITNSPFGTIEVNQGFSMIVTTDRYRAVKQDLNITYNQKVYNFIRYRYGATWTDWKENITNDNGMVYKLGEHELDATPYRYNFNDMGLNTCYFMRGFDTGNRPSNSPNISYNTPYAIMTFGEDTNNMYQLVFTGTNNRVYFRHAIAGTFTDWKYLTTDNDLESESATIMSRVNTLLTHKLDGENIATSPETLTQLNAHEFSDFGIYGIFLYNDVFPDRGSSGAIHCYIFNYGNKQIIETDEGDIYTRSKVEDVWSAITRKYYNTGEVDTLIADKMGIEDISATTISGLNELTLDTKKIYRTTLLAFPTAQDSSFAYILNSNITPSGSQKIRTFILGDGRTYTQSYSGGEWGAVTTPYYTKDEIDAMINS